jgi:hypothetical protein
MLYDCKLTDSVKHVKELLVNEKSNIRKII